MREALRFLLLAVLAVLGALLAVRAFAGPFGGWVPVQSPLNAQCMAGVCATLLILRRGRSAIQNQPALPLPQRSPRPRGGPVVVAAVAAAIVALSFWPSLHIPFTSDDFTHLALAHSFSAERLQALLTATGADEFFRPAGYIYMAGLAHWAGFSAFRWHLAGLVVHIASCLLLYSLARRLGWRTLAAGAACLIFGLHGSRPESVVWKSSAFDLLSTLFVLGSLHFFLSYRRTSGRWHLCASLLSMTVALSSKEVAFVTPLLLVLLLYFEDDLDLASARRLLPWFLVAGALFCYRWYVVGGIGGYAAQTGESEALGLDLAAAGKVLLYRLWGPLYFPINWSNQPNMILAGLTAIAAAVYVLLALVGGERRRALGSAAFVLICSLPALSQSLIAVDLEKSRLLYLPSAGFALLLGCAVDQVKGKTAQAAAGAAIALFFWASLQHNLVIWQRVANLGDRACREAGSAIEPSTRRVTVSGLPNSLDGVYFFRNGFEECIERRSQRDVELVRLAPGAPLPEMEEGALRLRWDSLTRRLWIEPPERPSPREETNPR